MVFAGFNSIPGGSSNAASGIGSALWSVAARLRGAMRYFGQKLNRIAVRCDSLGFGWSIDASLRKRCSGGKGLPALAASGTSTS